MYILRLCFKLLLFLDCFIYKPKIIGRNDFYSPIFSIFSQMIFIFLFYNFNIFTNNQRVLNVSMLLQQKQKKKKRSCDLYLLTPVFKSCLLPWQLVAVVACELHIVVNSNTFVKISGEPTNDFSFKINKISDFQISITLEY